MSRETTIRDLRSKVRQLEGKKRDLDKEVEALHVAIRVFEQNGQSRERQGSSYARELTDAMADILGTERPLRREVILERLQERGIHVGGAKPVNSIGSYLSTDDRFRNVGKGLWMLAVKPSVVDERRDEESTLLPGEKPTWRNLRPDKSHEGGTQVISVG